MGSKGGGKGYAKYKIKHLKINYRKLKKKKAISKKIKAKFKI